MKTIAKGPWLGINNRLPDFGLHVSKVGDYVREAINVDLTDKGTFQRRKAVELVQALTGAHSLYKNLLVLGGVLYRITLPSYTQTLVKILSNDDPVSYAEFNGDIYFSNGTDSGRIAASGLVYPWALPTPAEPTVAAIAGALYEGWYQVAVSYSNSVTGEEGGVSASHNFQLSSPGSLRVTLPGAVTGATHINVYVSTVNGSVPLLQTTVAVGTASVDLLSLATNRREAIQRYEDAIPAGRPFIYNGQLCTISGSNIYYGIPYRLGYYLPASGRIPFPDPVATVAGNQFGIYASTAKQTHFFPGTQLGSVEAEAVRDPLPFGAVPGTEFNVPNKPLVGWMSDKGFVIADTQGQVEAVAADAVDFVLPASGVSTVLETRGYRRVVSCGYVMNLGTNAVTSYTGWDFTSTSNGYGVKADGIYRLEGDGLVENWLVDPGKINFGAENKKTLPAVYLGCSSEEPLWLRVTTPKGMVYEYQARSCSDEVEIHRVDPGRGLRENWLGLAIFSDSGTDFTLASVSFAPVASQRRIS